MWARFFYRLGLLATACALAVAGFVGRDTAPVIAAFGFFVLLLGNAAEQALSEEREARLEKHMNRVESLLARIADGISFASAASSAAAQPSGADSKPLAPLPAHDDKDL